MEFKKGHENFIKHLKEIGRPQTTVVAYTKDIEQLISHLEARNVENLLTVEFDNLNEFIDSLRSSNYTLKSISRKINSIKTFFKYLNNQGFVKVNPSKDLKHPKVESKAPRILSRLEYGALRDACREDVRTLAMVEILLQTGLRISELSELKVGEDYGNEIESISFTAAKFEDAIKLINGFISQIFNPNILYTGLTVSNPENMSPTNIFPYVVTPSKQTYEIGKKFLPNSLVNDVLEYVNYRRFYHEINLNNSSENGWFLVWDNKGGKPIFGPQADLVKESIFPSEFQNEDITYGALGAQYLYLLSQNATIGDKQPINLSNTLYGIPQDKFIGVGDTLYNQTCSSVRGEPLMVLISKMIDFLINHVHPCAGKEPDENTQGSKTSKSEITSLSNNANKNILNQNIRLN
jgi:hypothetical protein